MSTDSVDVVIPIFNEQASIPELVARLKTILNTIENLSWQIILVENGSTDASHFLIQDEVNQDPRIVEVQLVRNFGTEGGILAGLSVSRADACITLQGDLEDPPELVENLIAKWREGYEVVYGEIVERNSTTLLRQLLTAVFYRLATPLSEGQVLPNHSDYRLMSRMVYEFVVSTKDQSLFLRSLVLWPTNKICSVPFARTSRPRRQSKFNTLRVIGWSFTAILTMSMKPLRFISGIGIIAFAMSLFGLVGLSLRALFWSIPFPGFGTIVGLQVLFFGLFMMSIGVLAEYIAKILIEVRPRPKFMISAIHRKGDSR